MKNWNDFKSIKSSDENLQEMDLMQMVKQSRMQAFGIINDMLKSREIQPTTTVQELLQMLQS